MKGTIIMNSKIIAVDFDGCLCENKWPEIGEPNEELISELILKRQAGTKLILWTCRVGELLENAKSWCFARGLVFDAVNENLPETFEWMGGDSRKIFAHEYIDDRAVNICFVKDKPRIQALLEHLEEAFGCPLNQMTLLPSGWTRVDGQNQVSLYRGRDLMFVIASEDWCELMTYAINTLTRTVNCNEKNTYII